MCKFPALSLSPPLALTLVVLTLVAASGCSSKPEVVLVRPAEKASYATYAGARDGAPGTVYDQNGLPMRLVYRQSPADPKAAYRSTTSISKTPTRPAAGRAPSPKSQPVTTRSAVPRMSTADLLEGVHVKRDYISTRLRSRTGKSMKPRYITIHSTQNWSKGADCYRHALALKRGALGKLCWHYTADEKAVVQHLPTSEQGQHADFDGPGNRYSIGIEMCEHPGNSRPATIERTAKLTAWLMAQHNIPLSRVVPHYHWPRHGMSPEHKNCPHFLLDNGRPGRKWRGFQAKVKGYYDAITLPQSNSWAAR